MTRNAADTGQASGGPSRDASWRDKSSRRAAGREVLLSTRHEIDAGRSRLIGDALALARAMDDGYPLGDGAASRAKERP